MNPNFARRVLLPLLVAAAAGLVFVLVVTGGGRRLPTDGDATSSADTGEVVAGSENTPSTTDDPASDGVATPKAPEASDERRDEERSAADLAATEPPAGLYAEPIGEAIAAPSSIGSLDPDRHPYRIDFAPTGAGIEKIVFSDYWRNAAENRRAVAHRRAVERGDADPPPLPAEIDRYQLTTLGRLYSSATDTWLDVPLLAMRTLQIDGAEVWLFGAVWSETAPGVFESVVRDADGNAVVEVERAYRIEDGPIEGYRLSLQQQVRNVSGRELVVTWGNYGPGDLDPDRDSYIEVRRFHFGYVMPQNRDPSRSIVLASDQMYDRKEVVDRIRDGDFSLWPNAASLDADLSASWFGSTNRYFGLAVHAAYDPPAATSKLLDPSVLDVRTQLGQSEDGGEVVFSLLEGGAKRLASGETGAWDLGVYAGPLERTILIDREPFAALNLGGLITYVMNSCCTICTFSWLANLLVVFLTFIHDWVVFDWGLSIILLVLIVRGMLHPLTRRSQIQMTRFGKGMAELKPQIDALQAKYKDDPRKLQQEQMRLYRERGVNPAGCLGGMLPMFLQMPIWIALYAMLFFAFELRQQPAFFGVFQLFGGWGFLGDLSAPDRFIPFSKPIDLWLFSVSGLNVLPLLMGLVFWFQQKYMTPPTTATLTDEQKQQQKIMKIMMVVMFPVMLYAAPSGLTLYILTSSCIGIAEGRIIRKRIAYLDTLPKDEKKAKPSKTRDKLGRMYAEALERAQEKQRQKQRGGKAKRFKDRK